jgi:CarD family transcriptional regulator
MANLERLRSGDRSQITEVVRQLSKRDRVRGISQGERRMLGRARPLGVGAAPGLNSPAPCDL